MFLKLAQRLSGFGLSAGSSRQRVMAGALVVAAVAVACGSDSSPVPASDTAAGVNSVASNGGVVKSSDPAPSFVVDTFNHGTYDLDATVGRPVLINFWFPSCPPCRAEMPDLQAAFEKYGDDIDFLGVQQTSVDTAEEGVAFLRELGITYPNFADETEDTSSGVQIAYQVLSFPTTVFLNRDHSINRTWSGLINEEKLEEQIEAVINS